MYVFNAFVGVISTPFIVFCTRGLLLLHVKVVLRVLFLGYLYYYYYYFWDILTRECNKYSFY
jgi:hypothetical protein